MPPAQSSQGAAAQLLGQLGTAASMVLGGSTLPTTSGDLYVGLMQSDAILDQIIKKYELVKVYDVPTLEDARKLLSTEVLIPEVDAKSGIISVTVGDKDPSRAAGMANDFVVQLRALLGTLAVTEASKKRLFFESQLKEAYEMLGKAEEGLQGFQETTGLLKLEEQAQATLQGAALLKAQVTGREVQLQVMRTYATEANPDMIKAGEELKALKEQLAKLEEKQETSSSNVIIPTGLLPNLGREYIVKIREFKYREVLYDLIAKQYEAARLDEAKDAAIVQVIHEAKPPEKRAKPKIFVLVAVSTLAGGCLFTLLAFLAEAFEKASHNPENAGRLSSLTAYARKL